jgi:hypothetical protein
MGQSAGKHRKSGHQGGMTYNDEMTSCDHVSFSNAPPCTRSENEPESRAEEDDDKHNINACCTDHVQDVQASTGDEEESYKVWLSLLSFSSGSDDPSYRNLR